MEAPRPPFLLFFLDPFSGPENLGNSIPRPICRIPSLQNQRNLFFLRKVKPLAPLPHELRQLGARLLTTWWARLLSCQHVYGLHRENNSILAGNRKSLVSSQAPSTNNCSKERLTA